MATRADANGNLLAFTYDVLDRLRRAEVLAKGPTTWRNGDWDYSDVFNVRFRKVTSVEYGYDPETLGLTTVTSKGVYLGVTRGCRRNLPQGALQLQSGPLSSGATVCVRESDHGLVHA